MVGTCKNLLPLWLNAASKAKDMLEVQELRADILLAHIAWQLISDLDKTASSRDEVRQMTLTSCLPSHPEDSACTVCNPLLLWPLLV